MIGQVIEVTGSDSRSMVADVVYMMANNMFISQTNCISQGASGGQGVAWNPGRRRMLSTEIVNEHCVIYSELSWSHIGICYIFCDPHAVIRFSTDQV